MRGLDSGPSTKLIALSDSIEPLRQAQGPEPVEGLAEILPKGFRRNDGKNPQFKLQVVTPVPLKVRDKLQPGSRVNLWTGRKFVLIMKPLIIDLRQEFHLDNRSYFGTLLGLEETP
jgi:hypothetical protein